MKTISTSQLFGFFILIILFAACNKDPYPADYDIFTSKVLGRENCKGSDTADFWLLDLSVEPTNRLTGDTVTFNGSFYADVVKVKGLSSEFRHASAEVMINYREITPDKVVSTACTISNPLVYPLRVVTILEQLETP